jgi:hypothetical protein
MPKKFELINRCENREDELTVVFVFVYPTAALFSLDHKFIISKSGINKRVDEGSCKISPCGVYIRRRSRTCSKSIGLN